MDSILVPSPAALDAFLTRWRDADGPERANYPLFVGELCALLDLPVPDPATGQPEQDGYVFERRVIFRHGDGSESVGFIDLYRTPPSPPNPRAAGPASLAPRPWPKVLAEQARAVTEALAGASEPLIAAALATRFQDAKVKPLAALLDTLIALGRAREIEGGRFGV